MSLPKVVRLLVELLVELSGVAKFDAERAVEHLQNALVDELSALQRLAVRARQLGDSITERAVERLQNALVDKLAALQQLKADCKHQFDVQPPAP